MFYTYNRKNLELKRFGFKHYSILVLVLFLTYTAGRFIQVNHLTLYEKEFIIYMDRNYFSQDALIESLKAKHLKFPHIVLAQATLETGGFRSKVFKQNHNLFGMKQSLRRPTTCKGTKNNHAYYDHWESSVEDYGYYQATSGLIKARTDQQYYNLLSQMGYAEDPNYILKVKKLAEELKHKF
jgi:hypothetical protein